MPQDSDPWSLRDPASRTHERQSGDGFHDANLPAFLRRKDRSNTAVSKDITTRPSNGPLGLHNRYGRGSGDRENDNNSDRETYRHRRVSYPEPRSRSRSRERISSTDGPPQRAQPLRHGEPGDTGGPGPAQQPMIRIDPASPQDVTVHMSLPLQDDLEDVLEECSRLRRLGHFNEAIALFRNRLSYFLDNRYVLVQYAQCLYEAGQHAELEKLAKEKAPPRLERPDSLQLNWDMLLVAAGGRACVGPLPNVDHLFWPIKAIVTEAWPRLDSTEV